MIQKEKINNTHSKSENTKRLSVQISLTGLSFLISCVKTKKIEWKTQERWLYSLSNPEELLERCVRILENTSIDLHQIKNVSLFYHTPLYTIVPTQLWNSSHPLSYLKYTLKTLPQDFVTHENILHNSAKLVYIPFVNINNYFFETFGSFHYYHALGCWVDYCAELTKNTTSVFTNITSRQMDVLVFKKGQLHLLNSFEYYTKEDLTYYLLFIYEQLELNPDKIPLYLSGSIDQSDPIYSLIYRYIRFVEFIDTQRIETQTFNEEAPHKNLLLKLGIQCV